MTTKNNLRVKSWGFECLQCGGWLDIGREPTEAEMETAECTCAKQEEVEI